MSCLGMPCLAFIQSLRGSGVSLRDCRGYLREATTSLVLAGGILQSVVDHARMIEPIRHVAVRDSISMVSSVGTHSKTVSFRDKATRAGPFV